MNVHKCILLLPVVLVIISGCSINPSQDEAIEKSRKGDELFAGGDLDGAVGMWKESINHKRSADLYAKIVMVQIVKNDLAEAEKWTCEGLTYFPNNVNLLFNNALIKLDNKDFAGAMNAIDRVLESNGYYPNAHFLKGLIYEKMGDEKSAKKEFVDELNINPGSKGAWQKLRGLTND